MIHSVLVANIISSCALPCKERCVSFYRLKGACTPLDTPPPMFALAKSTCKRAEWQSSITPSSSTCTLTMLNRNLTLHTLALFSLSLQMYIRFCARGPVGKVLR